ncbi:hypothetical protein PVAR5_6550 [Paecilomyces variotii No. 5]|uniref:Uncharacterized protein n=1 Tax=Byssochlamys spectabilis (strain No. 5 / NBRC 109023) TaxID=1356009 RepID=V5GAD3_BYSSN|nr:hypothetical protein PVAR5_6550 [Paecilomyces variotii No. 5]
MKFFAAILPVIGLVAADTLQLDFHSGPSCSDSPFQTFTIGNVGECHNTAQTFHAFLEHNIAQSFFGRNLRVFAFAEQNCQGSFSQLDLSNGLCGIQEGASFRIDTKTS